jgi:hypothetical protein
MNSFECIDILTSHNPHDYQLKNKVEHIMRHNPDALLTLAQAQKESPQKESVLMDCINTQFDKIILNN